MSTSVCGSFSYDIFFSLFSFPVGFDFLLAFFLLLDKRFSVSASTCTYSWTVYLRKYFLMMLSWSQVYDGFG